VMVRIVRVGMARVLVVRRVRGGRGMTVVRRGRVRTVVRGVMVRIVRVGMARVLVVRRVRDAIATTVVRVAIATTAVRVAIATTAVDETRFAHRASPATKPNVAGLRCAPKVVVPPARTSSRHVRSAWPNSGSTTDQSTWPTFATPRLPRPREPLGARTVNSIPR
ncbi:MAG: hypothetical protein ACKOHN_08265, partial [Actinomycetota bacterium]